MALFAPGYRNRFGHPRAGRRRALRTRAARESLRTDLDGAVTLDIGAGTELVAEDCARRGTTLLAR